MHRCLSPRLLPKLPSPSGQNATTTTKNSKKDNAKGTNPTHAIYAVWQAENPAASDAGSETEQAVPYAYGLNA